MYQKNKNRINKLGKIYVLGAALVCGLLLLSVDDCEGMYTAEQEQYAREQAARSNDKTLAARMEQEAAMQRAIREKGEAEQAARIKAEEESFAARSRQQASQNQTAAAPARNASGGTAPATSQTARAPASGTQTTDGRTASSGAQGGRAQTAAGGTTTAAAATTSRTSAAAGETAAAPQVAAQGGTAQSGSSGANYVSSIAGKNWKLTELRFTDKTVVLNRGELSGGEADIFTLTVDNERLSGKGAPNRYFTAYQAGANNALTIRPIAGTLMAVIITNPQRIREPDYFQYLAKVKSWRMNQNRLELNSLDKANKELVMVFSN